MTEEEKIIFWGDLVEPMTALLGGLLVRGEYKLVDVVKDIVAKAENAALEEREACAALCFQIWNKWLNEKNTTPFPDAEDCAAAIRARGLHDMNQVAEQNGEEL
jgi:hypothetical protein